MIYKEGDNLKIDYSKDEYMNLLFLSLLKSCVKYFEMPIRRDLSKLCVQVVAITW